MKKKWLKSAIAIAMVLSVTVSLSACTDRNNVFPGAAQEEPESTQRQTKESVAPDGEGEVLSVAARSFVTDENAYQPLDFQKNAPQYQIAPDLSNIENKDQFPNLTAYQRSMIARNGFVVIPSDSEQLFYIYEGNMYKKIPNFVTADSVLQLYHIYYDYALRNVESDYFYEDTITMNQALLDELISEYRDVQDEEVKGAFKRVLGYFATANLVLEQKLPDGLDADVRKLAENEYRRIMDAAGFESSPVAGSKIDYSLFKPRGHYTRSEELQKYFRVFSWYGVAPFTLDQRDNVLCALIMADALKNTPEAEAIWDNIYATTSFMVGNADDIMPYEISDLAEEVYGKIPAPDELPGKLDVFMKQAKTLRKAEIVSKQENAAKGLQMRFMGQRYLADSEILQKLSEPDARAFPTGLDVLAVYGSERAEALLDQIYRPNVLWPDYQKNYDELADKFRNQTIAEKTSNVYNGWLFALNGLTEAKGEGYPLFMRNDAWMNKSINTSLASWAELRHDTILYGKQSGAECGGGEEPPELMGYVEPDPEFFHRLIWLTETTRDGLEARGALSDNMHYKTENILDMLRFLEGCAVKELAGEDLSAGERYTLLVYGGTLEYISSSIAESSDWYLIESETDRNMAVVADVHTTVGEYLEEGVGNACEIYVAVPQDGKVYLTRGAVFDYYEFTSSNRLTDEEWQKMLKEDPPERVPYAHTFMDENGSGGEIPTPDTPYTTGC